ncbi:hypothetical protein [Ottowia thiooxydans]|uniref:Glycosyltransferase n=1 Tax=Ottowia thiooxydans TaxID=219182 RepID=A0ABV2QAK6_9BURK
MSNLRLRVCSLLDSSDYGLIGIGFVDSLRKAGIPVQWVPLKRLGTQSVSPMAPDEVQACLSAIQQLGKVDDLAGLVKSTAASVNHDAVFLCIEPEYWPRLLESGKRHAGYVLWDSSRLPTHWVRILEQTDAVCVPSRFTQEAIQRSLPEMPLFRIPPVYSAGHAQVSADAGEALRSALDLPDSTFVFYSMGPWLPQNNQRDLVRAFAQAFDAQDPVTLVLNTSEEGLGVPPWYSKSATDALLQIELDRLMKERNTDLPAICLLPYTLNGLAMEALHHLGDCYVSLSHGTAWDMMAYLAALRGNPVVMTKWGGQCDFLGSDWPGAIDYRLQPTPVWPPSAPLNWPDQRWAQPSIDSAMARMREAVEARDAHEARARRAAAEIARAYPETAIVSDLLEVFRALSAPVGADPATEGANLS